MSKKDKAPVAPDNNEVDMERIKEMMGPLPDEGAPEVNSKKSKKRESKKQDATLASAAAEANEAIKAMSPDLGNAKIEKIADEEVLDAAGKPITAVDEPTDLEEDNYLDAISESGDDPVTEKAVDDIVAHEGDTVLEAEDEKLKAESEPEKPVKKGRFKAWIAAIWAKPAGKWGIIGGFVAILLAIALIPYSRYFILNSVGVRSTVSVTVKDNGTQLPLKNVQVTAAGVTAQTDDKGVAKLEHVKLGSATLIIEKRAFAVIKKPITIGWGSNPLGDFQISAIGTQYSFLVTDFLSGKPIEGAQASSGEGNALSDKEGKITLTLDVAGKSDSDQISVQISAENYRTDTVTIATSNKEAQAVKMVPDHKHVFISKRSGKYDVYTIDVDGKNEKRLVAGTGVERDDIALLTNKAGTLAALVATRENAKNSDGYLLSTLYSIDVSDGELTKIDQSEQIQLLGWSDEGRLGYIKIASGASAANPKRQRLMSFNGKDGSTKELASANYFNDEIMVGNKVYYAPSSDLGGKAGFFVIGLDGSGLTTIYDKIIWNIYRTAYDSFSLDAAGTWLTHKIGSGGTTAGSPATLSRMYVDSPDGKTSLWADERDGKGVLLTYDKAAAADKTLLTRSGLKNPVYWLSNTTLVFRVSDGKEIADYVYNTAGGEAKKIVDVTDAKTVQQWYY